MKKGPGGAEAFGQICASDVGRTDANGMVFGNKISKDILHNTAYSENRPADVGKTDLFMMFCFAPKKSGT